MAAICLYGCLDEIDERTKSSIKYRVRYYHSPFQLVLRDKNSCF